MERVQRRLSQHFRKRTRHNHRALRKHLEGNILPALSFYEILREEGYDQQDALGMVDRMLSLWADKNRWKFTLAGRLPFFYELLRASIRRVMRINFPAEGWEIVWVEESDQAVAFNIHGCFYLDTLTDYGAPELTPCFCQVDDALYEDLSPHVEWGRTMTLGRGDEVCNFIFKRR